MTDCAATSHSGAQRKLHITSFLQKPLGEAHTDVRNRRRHTEAPPTVQAGYVRGRTVAAESLLLALLRYGNLRQLNLLLPPEYISGARDNVHTEHEQTDQWRRTFVDPRLRLCSPDALRMAPTDIILDTSGQTVAAFRIREHMDRTVAVPVVSVQHSLSDPRYIFNTLFRISLMNVHLFDSLVCSTTHSKRALTNLLRYMMMTVTQDIGHRVQLPIRIDCIPLCVDTDNLTPGHKVRLKSDLGLSSSMILVTYIGFLSATKADLFPLLSVFRSLVQANQAKSLCLLIAGTGTRGYIRALDNRILALGLQGKVIVKLAPSERERDQLLKASDVFVSPSDGVQESFGITTVEAMACGVPQVVSDWNGYRDTVVHGETGFRIPTVWAPTFTGSEFPAELFGPLHDYVTSGQSVAIDQLSLFHALQRLIGNSDLRERMGDASRRRACSEYSYQTTACRYDELLTELDFLARGGPYEHRRATFYLPTYYECFGHYATIRLLDADTLDMSPYVPTYQDLKSMLSSAAAETHSPGLDEMLVRHVVARLVSRRRKLGALWKGITVRRAKAIARRRARQLGVSSSMEDAVATQLLLWLLKHGILVLASLMQTDENGDPKSYKTDR